MRRNLYRVGIVGLFLVSILACSVESDKEKTLIQSQEATTQIPTKTATSVGDDQNIFQDPGISRSDSDGTYSLEAVMAACEGVNLAIVPFNLTHDGVPDIDSLFKQDVLHPCLKLADGSEVEGLMLWWQYYYDDGKISPYQDPDNTSISQIVEGEFLVPLAESAIVRGDGFYCPPLSDCDEDGIQTYKEKTWGTDPTVKTSYSELSNLNQATSITMRVPHPFAIKDGNPTVLDMDELNSTIYQYVDPDTWTIDDNHTPENPDDDHLTMNVLLLPNAQEDINPMPVNSWPIDPNIYPPEVQKYLEFYSSDVSAISPEIRDTMLSIVNGTGEGYSTAAQNDVEAVERILGWNQKNITQVFTGPESDPYWGENRYRFLPDTWVSRDYEVEQMPFPRYRELTNFTSTNLFRYRKSRACITNAILLNAEIRAIGIPVQTSHQVSYDPGFPDGEGLNFSNHIQNAVYLGFTWTLRDFATKDRVREGSYSYLVITDLYRDNSEAIFTPWINISDKGIGNWSEFFAPIVQSDD